VKYVDLDSTTTPTKLILKASQPDALYTTFKSNYGLPTVVGNRTGAGFAVEQGMSTAGEAYVVCTTCHTPHSMYTASASASNPIAGLTSGTFPSYFFVAAPYNPGANTANGTKASSATQFCRQCHFTGAGGSNEGSNILTIQTAF
jgi:cytochrome c553